MNKLYVIRKYVLAKSASQAIKLEKLKCVDDCWLDEDWKKENNNKLDSSIGFLNKKI